MNDGILLPPRDTKLRLENYFNRVNTVRFTMQMVQGGLITELIPEAAHECKRQFVKSMEGLVEDVSSGRVPEAEGIGEPQLREMLEVARTNDWTKPETIRQLYQTYSAITGRQFDECLFEGLE